MKLREKNGKYLCPQCGDILEVDTVRYNKITNGIFKSDKIITETTYHSKRCGWSYTEKTEE